MLPYITANLRGSTDGLLQNLGFFPVSSNMHLLAHPASRRGSEKVCSFWTIDVSAVKKRKLSPHSFAGHYFKKIFKNDLENYRNDLFLVLHSF
jgi:hypothetical protein